MIAVVAAVSVLLSVIGATNRPDTSLGMALPLAISSSSCRSAKVVGDEDRVVTCTSSDPDGFASAEFFHYRTVELLRSDFSTHVSSRALRSGNADRCGVDPTIVGTWMADGVIRGELACSRSASGLVEFAWIDPQLLSMGIVRRHDGDAETLWQWWTARNFRWLPFGSSGL